MTATYWEIGRRVVEYEQGGKERAEYGETLLKRLAGDLSARFGRGFGVDNLQRFRLFYLAYPPDPIYATASRISGPGPGGGDTLRILSTSPGESTLAQVAARFPDPPTCGGFPSRTRMPVASSEPRRCAPAGPCASSAAAVAGVLQGSRGIEARHEVSAYGDCSSVSSRIICNL